MEFGQDLSRMKSMLHAVCLKGAAAARHKDRSNLARQE